MKNLAILVFVTTALIATYGAIMIAPAFSAQEPRTCVWVQWQNGNTINAERYNDEKECLRQSRNKIHCVPAECRPREDN